MTIVSISIQTKAQERFIPFNEELGYASHIYHIIQDSFGFLWAGTLTGLIKTDGYTYTKFTTEREDSTTIAANFTPYLHQDRFANIWANSFQYGISIYDRSEDKFHRIKAGASSKLKSNFITNFIQVNDSLLFICGNKGLEKVIIPNENYSEHTFEQIEIPDSIKVQNKVNNHLWQGTRLDDTRILFSSISGFFLFDVTNNRFYNYQAIEWLPSGIGYTTYIDTDRNQVWFAESDKELLRVDLKDGSRFRVKGLKIGSGETYIIKHGSDQLYIKENGGDLTILDLKSIEYAKYPAEANSIIGHTDEWSRRFLETKDGSLFMASNDISRFSHIPSIQRKIDGLRLLDRKSNYTTSYYRDDKLQIATFEENGILIEDLVSKSKKYFTKDISVLTSDLVMRVTPIKNDQFVFSAKDHAYLYDHTSGLMRIVGDAYFFRNCFQKKNGDTYLFEGAGGLVQKLVYDKDENLKKAGIRGSLKHIRNVRAAVENNDGSMWIISSDTGLHLVDENDDIVETYKADVNEMESLVGNSLECLYKDEDGNLWVGSLEGLSKFNTKSKKSINYTTKDGLDDTSISDIVQNDEGQIYVSSFDGIYIFDEATEKLNRVPNNKLINKHFSQRGLFKYKHKIYACGREGIDIISSISNEANMIVPQIQLTNIYNQDTILFRSNNLETKQMFAFESTLTNVKLEFTPIHYGSYDSKELVYRINNSKDWIDITNSRQINLSNLGYGDFVVRLKASNAYGIWSKEKKYTIKLKTPWYKSFWFYFLVFLFIVSVLYAMYSWRIHQLRKIQEQQRAIDKQIAEIELKALKAQMNPHFVFNSLNSVKALILEHKTNEAIEYLTSFSSLIRKILNNSNDKFIRLQDEIDTIKLYLDLESLRFDEAFSYDIKIDADIATDFIEVPALILQPYIENAIWHGLLHKQIGTKYLLIQLRRHLGEIEILIEDNGIGRAAAKAINTRSKSKSESLGLVINQQRIDLLKELYGNNAKIKIIDLLDENGRANGTRVVITFNAVD